MDAATVFVNEDLYVFEYGNPVLAHMCTNLTKPKYLVKTNLAPLPHNDYLAHFSVTGINKSHIFLTGGSNGRDK